MSDFSHPLGDAVKRARERQGLTQGEVAEAIGKDSRTILNIENYKGNPKMEVLYPLIRALHIDAREIFNPELQRDTPALWKLRTLVENCSEDEAEAVISVLQTFLDAVRKNRKVEI